MNNQEIIPDIVKLAEECPVFSIRGTCFYVIGLLSSTSVGANLLSQVGWQSKRQHRLEKWPVMQGHSFDEDLAEDYRRHYSSSSCDSRSDESSILASGELGNFDRRTMSTSEQTISSRQQRNRSTSSGCQLTNSDQWKTATGGSFNDRDTDAVALQAVEEKGQFLEPHSKSLHPNTLSCGSCKVLHVRQSSASFLSDRKSDLNGGTKERSRSLTESKTQSNASGIVKVDSDTKLQQLAKPNGDDVKANWFAAREVQTTKTMEVQTESESRSNKNRSDSYADSTTSGVSSCDSVSARHSHANKEKLTASDCHDYSDYQLSPELASLTIENKFEYLDNVRKRVKLRNTPNLNRHLSMTSRIFSPTSADRCMTSSISLDNSIFTFTSPNNAIGHDAVKQLQRSPVVDGATYHSHYGSFSSRSSSSSLRNKEKSADKSLRFRFVLVIFSHFINGPLIF